MTWRVVVMNFRGHDPPPQAMDAGYHPPPLGAPQAVRDDISAALADIDWSDPHRGRLVAGDLTLDLVLPAGAPIASAGSSAAIERMEILASGRGDPVALVVHLCGVNGWAAYDTAAGAFIDLADPDPAGWLASGGSP